MRNKAINSLKFILKIFRRFVGREVNRFVFFFPHCFPGLVFHAIFCFLNKLKLTASKWGKCVESVAQENREVAQKFSPR